MSAAALSKMWQAFRVTVPSVFSMPPPQSSAELSKIREFSPSIVPKL